MNGRCWRFQVWVAPLLVVLPISGCPVVVGLSLVGFVALLWFVFRCPGQGIRSMPGPLPVRWCWVWFFGFPVGVVLGLTAYRVFPLFWVVLFWGNRSSGWCRFLALWLSRCFGSTLFLDFPWMGFPEADWWQGVGVFVLGQACGACPDRDAMIWVLCSCSCGAGFWFFALAQRWFDR